MSMKWANKPEKSIHNIQDNKHPKLRKIEHTCEEVNVTLSFAYHCLNRIYITEY